MEYFTGINKNEALKYLGYRGERDEKCESKIDETVLLLKKIADVKVCHVVKKISSHNPLLFLQTEAVFEGEDIKKHLESSDECIFMAATLGERVDAHMRRLSLIDMADAVIFDACASAAIENVCNNYCEELRQNYSSKNLFLTERFSPGYGDMPLENQKYFSDILQIQKRIGVCVNSNLMLTPLKSVTALIGISKQKQKKRHIECENCPNFNGCEFRKKGIVCYE